MDTHTIKETFWDNGKIESRKTLNEDGKRDGLCESWYENGQLNWSCNWKDDALDGLYEQWFKNGQIGCKVNYKNGELDGLYEEFYDNGQMKCRKTYIDGLLILTNKWYENGNLVFNSYL